MLIFFARKGADSSEALRPSLAAEAPEQGHRISENTSAELRAPELLTNRKRKTKASYVIDATLAEGETRLTEGELTALVEAERRRSRQSSPPPASMMEPLVSTGDARPGATDPTPIEVKIAAKPQHAGVQDVSTPRHRKNASRSLAGTTAESVPSFPRETSAKKPAASSTGAPPSAASPVAITLKKVDAAPGQDGRSYELQAGAFQSADQAEALKVRIALLGMRSRVEPAKVGDSMLYRVRLGPYVSAGELERVQRRLSSGGVPGLAVRRN